MGRINTLNVCGPWLAVIFLLTTSITLAAAEVRSYKVHESSLETRQASAQSGKDRWDELHRNYLENLRNNLEPNGQCTWDNMVVRREWGDMSTADKKAYLSALWCLKAKPAQSDQTQYPGARSRWDDFVVAHLKNTVLVHRSPWLAIWHRQYIWRLERALREECGYALGLPYWHWSRYLDQDVNSWPLFDGSETSVSGNGTQTGQYCACIESGPFANWTINLGPQSGAWGCKRNPRDDGLGYNPSCIERTLQPGNLDHMKYEDVVNVIDQAPDADRLASFLEIESPSLHNMPHIFVGGTQIDVTFSSQDVWFYWHHCMVDFVLSVWQSVDFEKRTSSLPDSQTFDAIRQRDGWSMPTPKVTLDSEIYLADVFGKITVREAMWTNKNHYCYRYE